MQFLADESCDFRVVSALRGAGHDVLAVVEIMAGASDRTVLERSRQERRILITEDRDFGQLVFAAGSTHGGGVLYLRCPQASRSELPQAAISLVARLGSRLEGGFVVWTPNRIRVRPLKEG